MTVLQQIQEKRIIAIIRGVSSKDILVTAKALIAGGVRLMEITFDHTSKAGMQNTLECFDILTRELGGEILMGAGTVLTPEEVELVCEHGAKYIISPNTDEAVIRRTKELGLVSMPGALTPTEVVLARNYGADIVKLFPADAPLVLPGMIEKGHGKIINICSMMSELGRETVAGYAAAKGGLKMLTRNICAEFGGANIQCNGIGPGYIATDLTESLRQVQADGSRHPFDRFILSRTPAGRWGEGEDLAGPAVFLASDASNFVNGHILYVDGGILAYIGKQP